jgi:hypothetical protein
MSAANSQLTANSESTLNLAARINEAHERATDRAASAVDAARQAGELLLEAKAAVAHGTWSAWLTENVKFSERSARGYMRLARELPKLTEEKRQRVAEIPLRDASKELWKMKREEREEERRQILKTPINPYTGEPLQKWQGSDKPQDDVVELWTSARKILEASAKRIGDLNDLQRQNIRDEMKSLAPYLPGKWARLPEGMLSAAETARSQFLEDARKRAAELIKWVNEKRQEFKRVLLEVAAVADDSPNIYVGTKRGSAIQANIMFMGVPCWELPPIDDDSDPAADTDYVADYLESHPGATVDDAILQATTDLRRIVEKCEAPA